MAQPPKSREAGTTHSGPAGLSPRELMPICPAPSPTLQSGVEGECTTSHLGIQRVRN